MEAKVQAEERIQQEPISEIENLQDQVLRMTKQIEVRDHDVKRLRARNNMLVLKLSDSERAKDKAQLRVKNMRKAIRSLEIGLVREQLVNGYIAHGPKHLEGHDDLIKKIAKQAGANREEMQHEILELKNTIYDLQEQKHEE